MIGLTKSQSLCIVIISAISATLSIFGSSIIIHKTLSSDENRKRLGTVYKRILFGMSVMDLFKSIASALTTIPAPADSLGAYFAYGNTITCNIQGLFGTFVYGTWSYSLMLTIHYVAKIRFRMKESQERVKIEPFVHLVAIGFPLFFSVFYLFINAYNYTGNRCWVGPYPYNCIEDPDTECTHGANIFLIRHALLIILLLSIFIAAINMAIVFWSVHSQRKKLQRRLITSRRRSSLRGSLRGTINNLEDLNITDSPPTTDTADFSPVQRSFTIAENMEQDELREEYRIFKKTKAVYIQGSFHFLAFMISTIPVVIGRTVKHYHMKSFFPFGVIVAFLFPFQGFLNYLVYIRPEVVAIRRRDPSTSLIKAVKMATCTTEQDT